MRGKMRAVAKLRPEPGAQLVEVDIPAPGPRDVLVKVKATSICGTDVHIYKWDEWSQNRIRTPRIIGHEFAGEVVEVGAEVTGVNPGDLVSAETHIVCGRCYQCLTGAGHICKLCSIIGVDRDGAFAEYVALPADNAWLNPPGLAPELASIQEPLGNAVHTVLSGEIAALNVAIIGCGPIGLAAIAVAKACGAARVVATDVNLYRLGLAVKLGADRAVNAAQEDAVRVILEETGGEGADVVLEMSGHPGAIRDGFRALRNGGRVALLGIPARPVELDLTNDIVFKGAHVIGITGRLMYKTWYQTRALLASGRVNVAPIITHRFPLAEFRQAIELVASGDSGKVIMCP